MTRFSLFDGHLESVFHALSRQWRYAGIVLPLLYPISQPEPRGLLPLSLVYYSEQREDLQVVVRDDYVSALKNTSALAHTQRKTPWDHMDLPQRTRCTGDTARR